MAFILPASSSRVVSAAVAATSLITTRSLAPNIIARHAGALPPSAVHLSQFQQVGIEAIARAVQHERAIAERSTTATATTITTTTTTRASPAASLLKTHILRSDPTPSFTRLYWHGAGYCILTAGLVVYGYAIAWMGLEDDTTFAMRPLPWH